MTKSTIQAALVENLRSLFPSITWTATIIGAKVGRGVVGSVECDRVAFEYPAKDIIDATATFHVYLISASSTESVEAAAVDVMKALRANPTIDGAAIDSGVQRIIYGTPQGAPKATAAEITYEVLYDGT